LTLNFDRSSAVLPTVGGSIKGQHVNVPAWRMELLQWVRLHMRSKMKAARIHWSLLTVYVVSTWMY